MKTFASVEEAANARTKREDANMVITGLLDGGVGGANRKRVTVLKSVRPLGGDWQCRRKGSEETTHLSLEHQNQGGAESQIQVTICG